MELPPTRSQLFPDHEAGMMTRRPAGAIIISEQHGSSREFSFSLRPPRLAFRTCRPSFKITRQDYLRSQISRSRSFATTNYEESQYSFSRS